MAALFIDSTYDITIGILGDNLEWIDFKRFQGKKVSGILQSETHLMLKNKGFEIKNLSSVVTVAGPGFYTGLRFSEGFADVFSFFKIPHYSFFSYQTPEFLGVKTGTWMTKAYRGEYFFHHWNGSDKKNILIGAKEFEKHMEKVDKSSFYIHSPSAVDDFSRECFTNSISTTELLESSPQKVFGFIISKEQKEDSFYFRAPEDEFKVSM